MGKWNFSIPRALKNALKVSGKLEALVAVIKKLVNKNEINCADIEVLHALKHVFAANRGFFNRSQWVLFCLNFFAIIKAKRCFFGFPMVFFTLTKEDKKGKAEKVLLSNQSFVCY